MLNLKKKLAFGICIIFIISSVSACSKSEDTAKSASGSTQASSTVFGKVTKIDGKKITLSLGDISPRNGKDGGAAPSGMPQGGGKDGGPAPSGMPQGGGKDGGSAPSGMPQGGGKDDGSAPSGMPQGGNGGQPGGMGGAFTENGETLVITVDDESLIKVQSGNQETEGSIDDITVNSIVTLEYSKDKDISAIIVHNMDKPAKPDKKNNSSYKSDKK